MKMKIFHNLPGKFETFYETGSTSSHLDGAFRIRKILRAGDQGIYSQQRQKIHCGWKRIYLLFLTSELLFIFMI